MPSRPAQTPQQLALDLFHSPHYLRHNARRLEHLASLRLPLPGSTVLELGAGIGDHTTFYLDRGCTVTSMEARDENCDVFRFHLQSMPEYDRPRARLTLVQGDVQFLAAAVDGMFDVIHCYGLLYHLEHPEPALVVMAASCKRFLLLELCVSFGNHEAINGTAEPEDQPTQAFHGQGCRPTRPWVFSALKRLFPFVYVPKTQPSHEEFPIDWSAAPPPGLTRAVFIGSKEKLDSDMLLDHLPVRQERA